VLILASLRLLASAAAAFFGPHGAVAALARQRQLSRQRLYREADAVLAAVDGAAAAADHVRRLRQQVDDLQQRLARAEQRLAQVQPPHALLDPDKHAEFAGCAQAEGVSLPVAHRLLRVFLGPDTPSVAQLGRYSAAAAARSQELLAVCDELARPLATQACADEIFVGKAPILMVVEPESLCWLAGRKAEKRDGPAWAQELRHLPALTYLSRDAGTGMEKGVRLLNQERQEQERATLAEQLDHWHTVHEGGRALRKSQGRARKALERAEKAQRQLDKQARRGKSKSGYGSPAQLRWRQAERAFDQWGGNARAWAELTEALHLFTPAGELNTRARAEGRLAELLPRLVGAEWAKTKNLLQRPETFTFLDRAHEELARLKVAPELLAALLRGEGVRRRPGLARGEGRAAAVARGRLLVDRVVIAKAGEEGEAARAAVRRVLREAHRASSAVEGINSVVRMQQARHRRLSQGLLDLKRLYWNVRAFRTGRRRKTSSYGRLGLCWPAGLSWWGLLRLSPEELRGLLLAHAPPEVRQRWLTHGSERLRQDLSAQRVPA
jgi:hypothetical protein